MGKVIDQVTRERRPAEELWKAPNHKYYSDPDVYWKAENKRCEDNRLRQECIEAVMVSMGLPAKAVPPKTFVKELKPLYESYGMETLHKTVFDNLDSITWAMQNKDFKSYEGRSRYILAIISNHIPDAYKELEHKQKVSEIPDYIPQEEPDVIPIGRKQTYKDLTKFL